MDDGMVVMLQLYTFFFVLFVFFVCFVVKSEGAV